MSQYFASIYGKKTNGKYNFYIRTPKQMKYKKTSQYCNEKYEMN